jgi:Tfp pilus assembly protein FimT
VLIKKGSRGSLLVDWSTALSITATTAMVAVPGLRDFVHESQRSAVVNEIQLDVRRAARVANDTGRIVSLCALHAGGQRCDERGDWNRGWLAFVDQDGDGVMDPRERRLWRTRNPQAGVGVAASPSVIIFRPYYLAPYLGTTEADVTVWDRAGFGGARTVTVGPGGVPQLSEVRFPPRG